MPDELYIEQPHGFEEQGKVCLLNQALEGTKQAAFLWQKNLSEFLVNECGFKRSLIDPCRGAHALPAGPLPSHSLAPWTQ